MMPRSAQSSLSHCTTTRPGIAAGSSGTTSSSRAGGDHHAARVLAEVARQVLDAPPHLGEAAGCAASSGSKPAPRELGAHVLAVAAVAGRSPSCRAASPAGRPARREAERPCHLARRHAVAVGDDVGGHGGAAHAVAPVDVLDDLLALVAGRQVEVDVGPLAALLGEEALEQELHLHRVDGGDAERVADRAVGGRAAALQRMPLAPAEADDVPDDEEVAGEVELLDQRELVLDLRLRLRGERPEARARAVPGELAQVGRRASRRAAAGSRGSGSRGRRA